MKIRQKAGRLLAIFIAIYLYRRRRFLIELAAACLFGILLRKNIGKVLKIIEE